MNNKGLISVIIPVYNAERFIERAIKSAQLEEVGEIIVVDDKYPDSAINIVKKLQKWDIRIKILEHPDGKNNGASASRNLGIKHANLKYLAFLDADDYYLPNRFKKQLEFLENNPDYDGCYGTLGYVVDNTLRAEKPINSKITGVKKDISPEKLLFTLMSGKEGAIHVGDTILFRRYVFKNNLFNNKFELNQDIELLYRIAYQFKLKNCPLNEIIAIRCAHSQNRVRNFAKRLYYSRLLQVEGLTWLWGKRLTPSQKKILSGAYFSSITNFYSNIAKQNNNISLIKREYLNDILYFVKKNPQISLLNTYLKWALYYFKFLKHLEK